MGGGMSLHLVQVYQTGNDTFDVNVSDSLVFTTSSGTYVVTTSGPSGGLAVFHMGPDGELTPHDTQAFPAAAQQMVSGSIAIAEVDGSVMVFSGGDTEAAWGYTLQSNGQIGPAQSIDWQQIETAATLGNLGALGVLGMFCNTDTFSSQLDTPSDTIVAMQSVSVWSETFLLTLDGGSNQILCHTIDPDGNFDHVASLGALEGLAISTPVAMGVASFQDSSFAVVASATGSMLSVIEIAPDGTMTPVQQLVDTGSTRFANIQDMTLVQHGDHVFVLAVGADHGVTMLQLLPDGNLVFLQTLADDLGGALHAPSSITAQVVDDMLNVYVGTQDTASLVHIQATLSNLGIVTTSSPHSPDLLEGGGGNDVLLAGSDRDTLIGGEGDDILSSGPDRSTLTGGDGNDIFVIRAESSRVTITDFRPGRDRLDLSDLPMLRSVDQLEIVTTASGAIIRYRDVEIIITAHNSTALSSTDLFPNGILGPDTIPIIIGETEPVPPPTSPSSGRLIEGTNGHDSLIGGSGADTITGNRGNDTIRSRDGDDIIDGGSGHDRLWGGSGNDTIYGGPGNDIIGGGAGDDLLFGDSGNDTIFAAAGNDTIYGGGGSTRLWGGRGNDLIYGSDGGGRIGGGADDDTIFGNSGNDTIYGGAVAGDDFINAEAGDDVVFGGPGDDTLIGGAGDDFIGGGPGDDNIHGGLGDDTVRGAAGADTFVFLDGDETLLIEDFTFDDNDSLELDSNLWGGGLTISQLLSTYAEIVNGAIVLDFGDADILTLSDVTDISQLADHIVIV